MRVRRTFLLSNAVGSPAAVTAAEPRTIDFLWVNRLIVERRASWFADALSLPEFAGSRATVMGLLESADAATMAQQADLVSRELPNLELLPYGDPSSVFRSARFFVLPADVVYCNNALLEAMAHGVIPLISDVEGARLIVDHGVNGFVFPHSPEGLQQAMRAARQLAPDDVARMSAAAVAKVREEFSRERWAASLAEEYAKLSA